MSDKPPQPKKRRSIGFWAAVVLVSGGMLYPLSFGPACWISSRMHDRELNEQGVAVAGAISVVYGPILPALARPSWVQDLMVKYAVLGAPNGVMPDVGLIGDSEVGLVWERYSPGYASPLAIPQE